jgi:chitin biosynthesis protein CHS5
LIEFPSILLPPGATTGSIVNIAVHQNVSEEKRREAEFWALQNDILEAYGLTTPENPKLEVSTILMMILLDAYIFSVGAATECHTNLSNT